MSFRKKVGRRVIPHSMLPLRPPLFASVGWWTFLTVADAPGWVWGAVGTGLALLWIGWAIDVCTREEIKL